MFTEKDRNNRNILISENVVKKSGVNEGGYGVFAGRDYQKGDIVEKCVFLKVMFMLYLFHYFCVIYTFLFSD